MKEKLPIPEQRKLHSRIWEIIRTRQLLQISNLARRHFIQEGAITDPTGEESVTVRSGHNTRQIQICHSRGSEIQETTVRVAWDEVYGDQMLPYVHATRRTLANGELVGETAVYDSVSESSRNTLGLGAIRTELHNAAITIRRQEPNPVILQVPTSTLDL